jgi:CopG family transcriptional regulator/antitoxin EndoAI
MYQQINITLLQKTIELIDALATQDECSKLIDEAINFYVIDRQKQSLQQQLQEGATRHNDRDLSLAEDWFNLEQESIEQSKLVMD